MPFGQLIIGPPGSGKSTYCEGMRQFLGAVGRKCSVVNLDPANDSTPYPCSLDIRDLITLESVMSEEGLGPNGGVLYAMEELKRNEEGWLRDGLEGLGDDYVLFDCPGQVEVFTHHASLRDLGWRLGKLGYRLVALHLTDSFCLTQPSLYISTLLLSLRAMLQLDLPHLNVLTKIDKIASYGPLPFNLDFYTEVQDLSYLLPHLASEGRNPEGKQPSTLPFRHEKFAALNDAVVELIEDFGLVSFQTLAVEDKKSMMTLLRTIDRAGGYAFGGAEGANDTVWQIAMRESMPGEMDIQDVQERWIDRKEEFDELERRENEEAAAAAAEAEAEAEAGVGGGDIDLDEVDGATRSRASDRRGVDRGGLVGEGGGGTGAVKVVRKKP